jgi:anti-sigma factor RsiW
MTEEELIGSRMRCGKADGLIEAYVDGRLPAPLAAEMERHLVSCARCRVRVETARHVASSLAGEPAVRAPEGFADRVMNAVYNAALAGAPEPERGGRPVRIPARSFRRMGFSFILSAAVLAVGLFIPEAAYPRLAALEDAGGVVKNMMDGAERVIQGALRSADTRGGNTNEMRQP